MALFGTGDTPDRTADPGKQRRHMVEDQLRRRDIRDERILEVMGRIPREEFVRPSDRALAYDDGPLPIGHGATISQPFIVALMTQSIAPCPGDRVLEIGTGSGYQAAVLGDITAEVYSIEILEELSRTATARLEKLGYDNIQIRAGDGYRGWPDRAPFDAIVVTAAPPEVPAPLLEQLAPGGRMIIPVGRIDQELLVIVRTEGGLERQRVIPVRFVPMTGEAQEPPRS